MIDSIMLLTYLFSVWYVAVDGELEQAPVFIPGPDEDIEDVCGRNHVGCIIDNAVVIVALDAYTVRGCTVLTHEYFHLVGYSEQEIPYCVQNQWYMVHGSQ